MGCGATTGRSEPARNYEASEVSRPWEDSPVSSAISSPGTSGGECGADYGADSAGSDCSFWSESSVQIVEVPEVHRPVRPPPVPRLSLPLSPVFHTPAGDWDAGARAPNIGGLNCDLSSQSGTESIPSQYSSAFGGRRVLRCISSQEGVMCGEWMYNVDLLEQQYQRRVALPRFQRRPATPFIQSTHHTPSEEALSSTVPTETPIETLEGGAEGGEVLAELKREGDSDAEDQDPPNTPTPPRDLICIAAMAPLWQLWPRGDTAETLKESDVPRKGNPFAAVMRTKPKSLSDALARLPPPPVSDEEMEEEGEECGPEEHSPPTTPSGRALPLIMRDFH